MGASLLPIYLQELTLTFSALRAAQAFETERRIIWATTFLASRWYSSFFSVDANQEMRSARSSSHSLRLRATHLKYPRFPSYVYGTRKVQG
jgi:hypothetical protein